jgi:hypothetical protein
MEKEMEQIDEVATHKWRRKFADMLHESEVNHEDGAAILGFTQAVLEFLNGHNGTPPAKVPRPAAVQAAFKVPEAVLLGGNAESFANSLRDLTTTLKHQKQKAA